MSKFPETNPSLLTKTLRLFVQLVYSYPEIWTCTFIKKLFRYGDMVFSNLCVGLHLLPPVFSLTMLHRLR